MNKILLENPIRLLLLFALASGVYFAGTYAVTRIMAPDYLGYMYRYDGFSERLIRNSLTRFAEVGDADLGRFMVAFEEAVHIAAVKAIDGPDIERDVYPYISNYSAQYELGRLLVTGVGLSGKLAFFAVKAVALGGMVATVLMIVFATRRDFGTPHAIAVLTVFTLSALLGFRALSAYWLIFLSFLPFAVSVLLYPHMRQGGRFVIFSGLILGVIFLKSLTGYEYLSCIALSAVAPVLYHELQSGAPRRDRVLAILFRFTVLGAAVVLGFLLAVGMHIDKMSDLFGSFERAAEAVRLIAAYSAITSESGIRGGAPDLEAVLTAWSHTFLTYNFHINLLLGGLLLFCLAGALFGATLRQRWALYLRSPLFVVTLFSLIATLSWSFLMVKHSVVHAHINWVQNYMCLYVFLVISLVELAWPRERQS